MTSSAADALQASLGYCFQSAALLDEALTHASHVNELKSAGRADNERLEFLGDAVLSLIVSEYLASALPQSSEGALSKLKAAIVSEATLARAARRLQLGDCLKLGRGEERSKGREKDSLLADALEAVIAAVHLDGGFEASRSVTRRIFSEELQQVSVSETRPGAEDFKTQLQEWCQRRHDALPRYTTVGESGPDHDKRFDVQVMIQGEVAGTGTGKSKKEAEQQAAKAALLRLRT